MEHIGQKIKELRKKADMTQDRLAEYLGVSAQAVSKWEVGSASPDLSLIAPLCRLLGCSADELLGTGVYESDGWKTGRAGKNGYARVERVEQGLYRIMKFVLERERTRFDLHDCRADRIEYEDGVLSFYFPDGIFCEDYGTDWPNTGSAAVEYIVYPKLGVHMDLYEKDGARTVLETIRAEDLIEQVNSGAWKLEFLYRYDGGWSLMYLCNVLRQDRPDCRGQLFIGTKEPEVFCFNPPGRSHGVEE